MRKFIHRFKKKSAAARDQAWLNINVETLTLPVAQRTDELRGSKETSPVHPVPQSIAPQDQSASSEVQTQQHQLDSVRPGTQTTNTQINRVSKVPQSLLMIDGHGLTPVHDQGDPIATPPTVKILQSPTVEDLPSYTAQPPPLPLLDMPDSLKPSEAKTENKVAPSTGQQKSAPDPRDDSSPIATKEVTTAPPDVIDPDKMTIHQAARHGQDRRVRNLVSRKVDIDRMAKYGRIPLTLAAEFGHSSTVAILLCWGARVNAQDRDGYTALHWAAKNGHTDTARLLLENAASKWAKDNEGATPLRLAEAFNQHGVIILLEIFGAEEETRSTGSRPLYNVTVTNNISYQANLVMNRPATRTYPSQGIRWSATQTLGGRRMTRLEEEWLQRRDHDPFE